MKSNVTDEKSEFQTSNEFGESSEDTSGFFESSSTLNNEKLYKASAPEQFTTNANSRLRSRMKMQQVGDAVVLNVARKSAAHGDSLTQIEFFFLKFIQQQAQANVDPSDMTDSSSQSDDYGNCRGRRKATYLTSSSIARRKKGTLNAKERNLRRLESNERERMRMHSLNDAFQVGEDTFVNFVTLSQEKLVDISVTEKKARFASF